MQVEMEHYKSSMDYYYSYHANFCHPSGGLPSQFPQSSWAGQPMFWGILPGEPHLDRVHQTTPNWKGHQNLMRTCQAPAGETPDGTAGQGPQHPGPSVEGSADSEEPLRPPAQEVALPVGKVGVKEDPPGPQAASPTQTSETRHVDLEGELPPVVMNTPFFSLRPLIPICLKLTSSSAGVSKYRSGIVKRNRMCLSQDQKSELEKLFQGNPYPDSEDRLHLSEKVQLTDLKIQIWFQNRRARWRKANPTRPDELKCKASQRRMRQEISQLEEAQERVL